MTRSIEELCKKYGNESVHTEHVTALALELFDHTHPWLGVPDSQRPLLAAAGRLHDVAYSIAREQHAKAGPRIVLREGLAGFTAAQRADIAKIMALHSGKWRNDLSPRLLRLGAFLRAADGLDYSHAQDAAIIGVRRRQRTIHVSVHCDAFPHNVERANAKADLWRAVFPLDVRFALAGAKSRLIRRPHDDIRETARRLMWIQYKTILVHVDGAVEGTDPKHLHDLRVALRRLRFLFRDFRKELPQESVRQLERGFAQLQRTLVPRQPHRVRHALGSNRFRSLRRRMALFLRTEIIRLINPPQSSRLLARIAGAE